MDNRTQLKLTPLAFTFLLFASSSWATPLLKNRPCGTSGDQETRIKNCDQTITSESNVDWVLVTQTISRTGGLLSFWKDTGEEGMIWSNVFETKYGWHDAARTCTAYDIVQGSSELPEKYWKLPSQDDYELAEEHGIRDVLEMRDSGGTFGRFWTIDRTWWDVTDTYFDIFDSKTGEIDYAELDTPRPFSCVPITHW